MKKNKKPIGAYEINKKIRRSWDINPVTRIKDDERVGNKKRRQKDKNEIERFNVDDFD